MDNTLVAAYIGAISAIVGVILGSVITGLANWQEKSRHRKNVRRVLSWEHVYNIDLLQAFWKQVHQDSQLQKQSQDIKEFERNLRFLETPLDGWGHQMWQNYADEVAFVLSEKEFHQSYQLHTTLDTFSSRRKAFRAILYGDVGNASMMAYHKQKQLESNSPGAYTPNDVAAIHNTNEFVRPLWDECVRLYTICDQIGNPIQP